MIGPIVNLFKIKYVKLSSLTYRISTTRKGIVYIDLDCILKVINNKSINNYIIAGDDKSITLEFVSSVVNLASHYRQFFANNGKEVSIVIYTSYPFNNKDGYRQDFKDKLNSIDGYKIKALFDIGMPMVKTILSYVDGCHLVSAKDIDSGDIPYIHNKLYGGEEDTDKFIVTRDRFAYQYVDLGYTILRPKRLESYKITSDNLWQTLCLEEKIKPITLDNSFYKFVYTVMGDDFRGFEKIKRMGVASIAKVINKAVLTGKISHTGNSIFILERLVPVDDRSKVHDNYVSIDLERKYTSIPIVARMNIEEQITDKFDLASLEVLNNNHFIEHPIDIMGLNPTIKANGYNGKSVFANYRR